MGGSVGQSDIPAFCLCQIDADQQRTYGVNAQISPK